MITMFQKIKKFVAVNLPFIFTGRIYAMHERHLPILFIFLEDTCSIEILAHTNDPMLLLLLNKKKKHKISD